MLKIIPATVAAVVLATAAASPAFSFPVQSEVAVTAPVIPVAEGCGWGRWRGPWGGCRSTPYVGPLPGGGYAPAPGVVVGPVGNGCPPGYWRGPWGHCRDTPYHGRLPDGGWQ
ncbi:MULTISPECIES: GCG_CRPN prefix-to-repeats domain-containing protein [Azorhizobium]|uniref:GCG_CRPN prefix-to-repeats domain-containing protein n=1 Tax=Azorhizobium TaxID=6 RepID=UPI0010E8298A|nr:hypothetical protein [Azorhizobium sp. AG788]TDT96689.1 hypothetical protein DFO45_1885 [Azorhizobium sp. AG788]